MTADPRTVRQTTVLDADGPHPMTGPRKSWYSAWGKRTLDIIAAAGGLLVLSPFLVVVALIGAASFRGSPFFRQERPGKNAETFQLLKFRTMTNERGPDGALLPNHLRITRLGSLLRHNSVDELPQLWNVVKGDMSLVGPRPLLVRYLPLYDPTQRRRHEVRPGITGWAQVNGRNSISWAEKFANDVWYVDNLSFALDVRILWLTVRKVLLQSGVNAGESVTMPPFDGTN